MMKRVRDEGAARGGWRGEGMEIGRESGWLL